MSDLTGSTLDPDLRPGPGRSRHLHGHGFDEGLDGPEAFEPVLTMRARIDEEQSASFVHQALQEIHAYIRQRDLKVAGPPFSLCHPLPDHIVDVEAGWPVRGARGTARINAGAIPAVRLRRHNLA